MPKLFLAPLALLSLSSLSTVLGRVTNFSAPETVQAGTNLTAVLQIQNYISNWDDFGVRPTVGNSWAE